MAKEGRSAAFEVDQLARRRAELEQALEALPDEVKGLAERRDPLQEELKVLQRDADRLNETRNEVDRLQERKVELGTAIESRLASRMPTIAPRINEGVDQADLQIRIPERCILEAPI